MEEDIINEIISVIRNKEIVFLWSGGVESGILLRFFLKFHLYLACRLHVLCIPFPQEVYKENLYEIKYKLQSVQLTFDIIEPKDKLSHDIEFSSACGICKTIRRNYIDSYYKSRFGSQMDSVVFMTGHNLDDLASYVLENLAYSFEEKGSLHTNRFLETSNKLFPLYQYNESISFFRPLTKYSRGDLASLDVSTGFDDSLDVIEKSCYWLHQRKRLIQQFLSDSGVKLDYQRVRDVFLKHFNIPSKEEFESLPYYTYLL